MIRIVRKLGMVVGNLLVVRKNIVIKYIYIFLGFIFFIVSSSGSNLFCQPFSFSNIDQTDIYLVTVAPREELHRLFGHTIIRIQDRSSGVDLAVNWGMFDFNEKGFILKFLKGDLNYSVEAYSFRSQMNFWKKEKALVYQDKINLTSTQKQKLVTLILNNLKKENKYFKYSYFRKNCATYPRDYIDEVLSGYVKDSYSELTNLTYRKDALSNLALNPFAYMGVDLIFNSQTESQVSGWQLMYKPQHLREYLSGLYFVDDFGQKGQDPLLIQSEVLVQGEELKAKNINGYEFLSSFFILLLIVSYFLHYKKLSLVQKPKTLLFPFSYLLNQKVPFGPRICFLPYLIVAGAYLIFSTFVGVVLTFFWVATNQTDCIANFNLFMFWPIDIITLLLIIIIWIKKQGLGLWFRYYLIARIFMCVLGSLFYILGYISQDISRVIISFSLIHVIIYLLILNFEIAGSRGELKK